MCCENVSSVLTSRRVRVLPSPGLSMSSQVVEGECHLGHFAAAAEMLSRPGSPHPRSYLLPPFSFSTSPSLANYSFVSIDYALSCFPFSFESWPMRQLHWSVFVASIISVESLISPGVFWLCECLCPMLEVCAVEALQALQMFWGSFCWGGVLGWNVSEMEKAELVSLPDIFLLDMPDLQLSRAILILLKKKKEIVKKKNSFL